MECIDIPSELMENNIIKRIGESLRSLIGIDASKIKTNKIRVLVKIDLSNIVSRKIITNRSIYNLTFRECSREIDKIKDSNFIKMHIKNSSKDSPQTRKGVDMEKGRIIVETPIEKDNKDSQRV